MEITAPGIQSYTDYRTFLVNYAQKQKNTNKKWTYGVWAKRLGLNSTSSITKVIQGDRSPGKEMTEKMIQYFSFSKDEGEYFKDLIRLQKVKKDPRMAVLIMEKMGKEHPDKNVRFLDHADFSVISNWYCLAIREMTRLEEFVADPNWISRQFQIPVSAVDVSKALDNLLSIGLLKRKKNGDLVIGEGRVQTSDDMVSEAVKRYHESMLDNAKRAVRDVPVDERELTGSSIIISPSNIPKAKELIRQFRSKFNKIMEETSGGQVYQFQMQFFPLTRKVKKQRR